MAHLATDVFAALSARSHPLKAHLADEDCTLAQQPCCKNEEKLLERLDQAILDVSDNPN